MKKILFIILAAGLLSLTIFEYLHYKTIDARCSVTCSYNGYACGLCSAEYKINDIKINGYRELDFLGKDVKVLFSKSHMEKEVDSIVNKCQICYAYNFTGTIVKRRSDAFFIMTVDSFSVHLVNNDCCK
ncbi:MAG: hypothetical protein QM764_22240 [Chitinophagaceae bacterium]